MKAHSSKSYYAAGLTAFIIWGFIPIPLKELAAYSSAQILFYRIAFSVLILLFISGLFRRKELLVTWQQAMAASAKEKRSFTLYTLLGGLLLTVNWLAFIYVVNHISIQAGSFSYLLCPILTAVLGFLLLKEKLLLNQWLAIGLSAISCAMIGNGDLTSLLFSLLVGLTYALYLITQRILKGYDKIVLLTLQLLLSFALIAPLYLYFSDTAAVALSPAFFGVVAILSAGFTVLPLFLNLFALKELTSGTVGIMMYINPVINFLVAFIFYNEQTTPTKIMAYLLIFVSVIIYNLHLKGRKKHGNGLVIPAASANAVIK
ncbi:EamA family transporter [Pontibacter qinzhouensis]|uniref:EamA family transporter n=1 Tax=Pontibacter qinzhouensis TaxID=2603253 RepID=A0A5C8J9Y5_9BACT|nr:EamA family transporter [Pontibacter qinzhouensis]TXK33876.1 EamA family transporter [Pontibacter qinzhouensis]